MKILVCGGRSFLDYQTLSFVLTALAPTFIIEGGASGADALARRYRAEHRLPGQTFPANWSAFGRAAGAIRNRQMLSEGLPALVVAFPGGPGTADMILASRLAGVPVHQILSNGSLIKWEKGSG